MKIKIISQYITKYPKLRTTNLRALGIYNYMWYTGRRIYLEVIMSARTEKDKIGQAEILVEILTERKMMNQNTYRIDFIVRGGGFVFYGDYDETTYDAYGNIIFIKGTGSTLDEDGW